MKGRRWIKKGGGKIRPYEAGQVGVARARVLVGAELTFRPDQQNPQVLLSSYDHVGSCGKIPVSLRFDEPLRHTTDY